MKLSSVAAKGPMAASRVRAALGAAVSNSAVVVHSSSTAPPRRWVYCWAYSGNWLSASPRARPPATPRILRMKTPLSSPLAGVDGVRSQRQAGGTGSGSARDALAVLVKAVIDQRGDGVEGFAGLPAGGLHQDGGAGAGAQHHQAHDRTARDRLAVTDHLDLG